MKVIYLPIETKSREFDSRCLIALSSIQQGAAVVLGADRNVLSTIRAPGVVLLKSAAGFEIDMIKNLKQQGARICVLDEEGLVHPANEREHALRFAQTTLDIVDGVFFNGAAERNLMCRHYQIDPEKIELTGNPRFDFYKPVFRYYYESTASQLRGKYGPYIFIPSRFGEVGMATKGDFISHLKKLNYTNNEHELDIFRGFLAHSRRIYDAFTELLPKLARAFPEHTVVVRPHPSESHLGWAGAAQGLPNVRVLNEGPIGPWLLGAAVVLHNGCTTGLEAFLMDRPVFSYMPHTSEEFDLPLPNFVSIRHTHADTLLADIGLTLKKAESSAAGDSLEARYEYASTHLKNARHDDCAYANVAEALCRHTEAMPAVSSAAMRNAFHVRSKNLVKKVRGNIALKLSDKGIHFHRLLGDGYSYRKNPGFTAAEIFGNFKRLAGPTGFSTEGIKLRKLDEDMFLIYKA